MNNPRPRGEQLADDLLSGANAIATYVGESKRRIYYMLERGELPAFKMAGRWYARKSKIIARIEHLEAGEAE